MKKRRRQFFQRTILFFGSVSLLFSACSESSSPSSNTQQAAAQIEQAFANADASTKQAVGSVSDALRKGEYDRAVVSLTTIRSQPATTPEQQQAIQNSAVTLEAQLIRAMEAGDQKAKATYQLLKELKRN
jgi:hypothetical protein